MEDLEKGGPSELDKLKVQEQELSLRHEEMLKSREKNPNDAGLQINIDKVYDELQEVKRTIANFEKSNIN